MIAAWKEDAQVLGGPEEGVTSWNATDEPVETYVALETRSYDALIAVDERVGFPGQ